ncbi:hypothetical protein AKG33_00065 [Dichelobacter nodosus]|nr:hypothetical protein AKG33_00065 [Dichelobacter nodosus]
MALDNGKRVSNTGVLSKTNSGLPHPSNAVFLCLFLGKPNNGGTIAKEYNTFGEYFAAETVGSESESRRPQKKRLLIIQQETAHV